MLEQEMMRCLPNESHNKLDYFYPLSGKHYECLFQSKRVRGGGKDNKHLLKGGTMKGYIVASIDTSSCELDKRKGRGGGGEDRAEASWPFPVMEENAGELAAGEFLQSWTSFTSPLFTRWGKSEQEQGERWESER